MRLKKIKRIIKAPYLNDEPRTIQKAQLLNAQLWLSLLLLVIYTPILIIIVENHEYGLLFNVLLATAIFTALFIFHRGHLLIPTLILIFSIWLYISALVFFLGGIRNPAVISYVFLVMVSGLLLETQGLLFAATLSILTVSSIGLLEGYGRLPESKIELTLLLHWSALMIIIMACTGILYFGITILNNALTQAQKNEVELAKLIEKRTIDLTATTKVLSAEIANHELTEKALQKTYAELEQRVVERTEDLQNTNSSLQSEIEVRQRAEHERQNLIDELEAKNNELENFAYTVSHDLKSPLITIKGFLNFMENDIQAGKTERALQDIQRILNATDKMQELLNNLLELSKVGHITNPPTAVSLDLLVTEAIELLNGPISERGVTIVMPATMPDVFVDPSRLVEVFQNLISNGIKFMGEQTNPLIEIDISKQTETTVTCIVKDNGIGIDPEFQDQVFGLFERLDNNVEGTGIGLSLVKRIIEVHNGRIRVESEGIGHGTTFFISLPKPNQIDNE